MGCGATSHILHLFTAILSPWETNTLEHKYNKSGHDRNGVMTFQNKCIYIVSISPYVTINAIQFVKLNLSKKVYWPNMLCLETVFKNFNWLLDRLKEGIRH